MSKLDDRPMEYKLVWDRKEEYILKYKIKNPTLWERFTKWWAEWTTFCEYYEPLDISRKDDTYLWIRKHFTIRDNFEGENFIQNLYDKCPTFGKFWEVYRKPEHEKEVRFNQRQNEYFNRINKVKSEFK